MNIAFGMSHWIAIAVAVAVAVAWFMWFVYLSKRIWRK